MFATIRSVDAATRRCTIELDDGSGRRLIHDVLIGEPMPGSNCTPENGQNVEVSTSNSGWFISRYYGLETDRANQEREHLGIGPGDNVFGGVGNGTVGVLKGGIAIVQADDTTGLIASKATQTVNVLGRTMAFLNGLYQKVIVESIEKLRIDETISGPAVISPRIEKTVDTLLAEESIKYNGFRSIKLRIDGDLISQVPRVGTNIDAEMLSFTGQKISFKIDGVTGDISIESGLASVTMKAATGEILIGSDGNPLDGLVTGRTPCMALGVNHCGVSTKVKAGIL